MTTLIRVCEDSEFKCYGSNGDTIFVLDHIQAVSGVCVKNKMSYFTVYLPGNQIQLEFAGESTANEHRDEIIKQLSTKSNLT